jgi:hypothetical protein
MNINSESQEKILKNLLGSKHFVESHTQPPQKQTPTISQQK